jgi:hypothetical protein
MKIVSKSDQTRTLELLCVVHKSTLEEAFILDSPISDYLKRVDVAMDALDTYCKAAERMGLSDFQMIINLQD